MAHFALTLFFSSMVGVFLGWHIGFNHRRRIRRTDAILALQRIGGEMASNTLWWVLFFYVGMTCIGFIMRSFIMMKGPRRSGPPRPRPRPRPRTGSRLIFENVDWRRDGF